MGIDVHVLGFLRYERERGGDFGQTVMLGRQELHLTPLQVERAFAGTDGRRFGRFAEELLEAELGATSVDSLDNSDFEGASVVHDLNVPLLDPLGPFDVVLDLGTLEHVFDVRTALSNVSSLASVGGRIVHVLPGNQFCGHGFWQFAPELFFSLYTEGHGYTDTEVFVAELPREGHWWQVRRPVDGERVNLRGPVPMYVMCRTTKSRHDVDHRSVQQSDYVHVWEAGRTAGRPSRLKDVLLRSPLAPPLWAGARRYRDLRFRWTSGVNGRNPHLTRVRVPRRSGAPELTVGAVS